LANIPLPRRKHLSLHAGIPALALQKGVWLSKFGDELPEAVSTTDTKDQQSTGGSAVLGICP